VCLFEHLLHLGTDLRQAAYDEIECITNYCKEASSFSWAMRYTHKDTEERDISWVSDIGLRDFTESRRLVVSVKISYKASTKFVLSGKKFEPNVSIPWCVAGLFETFEGSNFYSWERDVTTSIGGPTTITNAEQAINIRDYIDSRDRRLAVILLDGETEYVRAEANCLSKNLFGKALVFILRHTGDVINIFRRYSLQFNECIFLPTFYADPSVAGMLQYSVQNPEVVKKRHQVIFRGWLGAYEIKERGAVANIEDIQILIRKSKFLVLQDLLKECVPSDEYERVKMELKDMSGLFELSEAEKKEKEDQAEKLKEFVSELKKRNNDLLTQNKDLKDEYAVKIYNMKATQEAINRKSISKENTLPRKYPNSFETLRTFAPFYKHLVFTDRAWEPALSYRQFKDFDIAWEMLCDLDQELWKLVFQEQHCDIEHRFQSISKFTYAKTEGKGTADNSKLAQLRKFTFEGKEYEMWSHLKYGNKSGKQLRIYFAYDQDKKRIIVGYIGDHMDNATTRNIR
jgi:hypothetical protein